MTQEEVAALAHEAGFGIGHAQAAGELFERFAALVAAAEREACAQACEAIEDEYHRTEGRRYPELKSDAETGACHCAAAIRARGST